MGLGAVAVYSDCDREALHVRVADEACHIGANPASERYLNLDRLVAAALASGATLVHPGYGFLAENAGFASACERAGLTFVGPSPDVIGLMGDKHSARQAAVRAGVPVVPGTAQPFDVGVSDDVVLGAAEQIGYPLLVKAVAGVAGRACVPSRSRLICRLHFEWRGRRQLPRSVMVIQSPCRHTPGNTSK